MKRVSVAVLLLILIVGGAWYAYVAFSTDDDTPDTPLAQIPLTFDDQMAMANLACDGHASVDEKKVIACRTCPQGSDFVGASSGPDAGWSNSGVLTGSFTAPGMDEALMRASGCESHANNMGGDFLFRRDGSKWSLVRYAKSAIADDKCLKSLWGEGRDAVICQNGDMHQGFASSGVQLMTFDTTPPTTVIDTDTYRKVNFVVAEDGSANCGFPLGNPQQTMQFDRVDRAYLVPTNTNRPSVIVKVTLARAKPGKSGVATCPAVQPESYTVTWKNLGDHFEAAEGYVGLAARAQDPCCDLMVASRVEPIHY
ncbi:hypothetical protein [Terriglobus roseus]|uniref:hypothetical protein n=1 Tax=Terriglobus roseus TaxID=392734 RepID=UPI0009F69E70|nr:hypothetical protein [Terriglobus roseus]